MNRTRKWLLRQGVELWASDQGELVMVGKGAIAVELSRSFEELRVVVLALAGAFRDLAGLPQLTTLEPLLGVWTGARTARISGTVWLVQTAGELWVLGQRPTVFYGQSTQAFIDAVFEIEAVLAQGGAP